MDARRLGKTDLEVSPIGLGSWQFSQGKGMTGRMWSVLGQGTMDSVVDAALKGGITWFDTAQAYGNGASERALSAALQHRGVEPGRVVIATKWLPILKTAGNIPRTIGTRIECLRPYPIDLFQVHIPWSLSSIPAQMREMASARPGGKGPRRRREQLLGRPDGAGRRGFAGRRADARHQPGARQPARPPDRGQRGARRCPAARRHADRLLAARPRCPHGTLPRRSLRSCAELPWGRRSWLSPSGRFLTPEGLRRCAPLVAELRAVAGPHGATPAQVALAWLVTYYGDAVVAIPGASRPEQAAAAAAAMDLRLTETEMASIDGISAALTRH